MGNCVYCNAETQLYDGEVPICVSCSLAREAQRKPALAEFRIRTDLQFEFLEAAERAQAAAEAFSAAVECMPGMFPAPDGVAAIRNASRELTAARKEMMRAHSRLNDFVTRGVIPDDLKQQGGS